jgi:hypothetical protein
MNRMHSFRRGVFLAAAFYVALRCVAGVPGDPTGETILRNAEDRMAAVKDYTVNLAITADIDRLNVPPMNVRMYFKQPDKVHFDARGFAMLPREGLALNIGKLRTRYTAGRVDRDSIDGIPLYRVTMVAKSERTRIRSVTLYVHPERWTVEKLVTPQVNDRVMSASFRYTQVQGLWLPQEMVAAFSTAPADTVEPNPLDQAMPARPQQRPRTGTVTVHYSDYTVNTGLSDDLFKEEQGKSPD